MKKIKSFCIRAKNFWSPKKLKKRLKQGGFIFPPVAYLGLWLWVAIMMFLLLWAFVSSLKTNYDFIYNPTKLPQLGWRWINYKYALKNIPVQLTINGQQVKIGVIQLLLNSLLLGIGNPIVGLIDVSVCSYIAARYKRFKVSKVIFAIVIWMGFVPIGVSLATEFRLLKALGLYNQIWGMWVWSSGGFGGFFLIYYATWKTLSWEYAEAAFVANDNGNFWGIIYYFVCRVLDRLYVCYQIFAFSSYSRVCCVAISIFCGNDNKCCSCKIGGNVCTYFPGFDLVYFCS